MFELIFGIFWTAFSCVFAFMMFGGDQGVTVNGEWVEQAEFNAMLGPKLFIGLFIFIGLVMIVLGLKKIISNILTATKGEETYGVVVDVYPSGSHVNGRPILNADIIIVESDGVTGRYTESIGMSYNKYRPNEFVKVRHYRKDINILAKADNGSVPYHIREKLESEVCVSDRNTYGNYNNYGSQHNPYGGTNNNRYDFGGTEAADTVIINGVEYVKKN